MDIMRVIDFRTLAGTEFSTVPLPRPRVDIRAALKQVEPIMQSVQERGAEALAELAKKFDGVCPPYLRVPESELVKAERQLSPELRQALQISIEHNRAGHRAQLPIEKNTQIIPGGYVRQRWIPVQRVGLYVPGGLAVYPSSVIHNAVAAQVAGVAEIALASPPQANYGGLPHPVILAACQLLGIKEVYAVGGAQAVAMFAYGIPSGESASVPICKPVDMVTGPGNIFVAAAKRYVKGKVGIDAEAGTTEIAILADENANPEYVAADLLSQAEHDPAAASLLITPSVELAQAVNKAVARQAENTKHRERVKQALSGEQSAIVITRDLDQAAAAVNAYGPEHLEIQTQDAAAWATKIVNAGAIFIGDYTPVPLGDYMAGSNHVLPTGGTARFSSGLNALTFLKSVQEITYTHAAMESLYAPLHALATAEDLPAHAHALAVRLEDLEN